MPQIASADSLRSLARDYLDARFGGALLNEKLDLALAGDESLQLTISWRGEEPAAFVLVEHVAGGHGTWRLHAACGSEHLCADAIERALTETWAHGGRLAVVELPDDVPYAEQIRRLKAAGFVEAGTVRDFFADGIGLVILTREIDPGDVASGRY
jgi:hypothetical protein